MTEQEVLRAADLVAYRRAGRRVEVIRCGLAVALDIEGQLLDRARRPVFWIWSGPGRYCGLDVVRDEWMEPAAWQLTDAAGTLFYDCRMGDR